MDGFDDDPRGGYRVKLSANPTTGIPRTSHNLRTWSVPPDRRAIDEHRTRSLEHRPSCTPTACSVLTSVLGVATSSPAEVRVAFGGPDSADLLGREYNQPTINFTNHQPATPPRMWAWVTYYTHPFAFNCRPAQPPVVLALACVVVACTAAWHAEVDRLYIYVCAGRDAACDVGPIHGAGHQSVPISYTVRSKGSR